MIAIFLFMTPLIEGFISIYFPNEGTSSQNSDDLGDPGSTNVDFSQFLKIS